MTLAELGEVGGWGYIREEEVVEKEEGDAQAGEVEEHHDDEQEEVDKEGDGADEAEGGAGGVAGSDDWNAWSSRGLVLMLSFGSCCGSRGLNFQ